MDAGTASAAEGWLLAFRTKARSNAPHLLPRAFAKGDALLHRGRHGTGEFGGVVAQRIISRGHGGVDARFQVPELPQCADDAPADLLDHRGDVGIAGRLALEKARREALVGAIERDPLEEDAMEMEVGVRRRLYLIV
jgi:hypothetical protein